MCVYIFLVHEVIYINKLLENSVHKYVIWVLNGPSIKQFLNLTYFINFMFCIKKLKNLGIRLGIQSWGKYKYTIIQYVLK